jgi:hypothetical protein
MLLLTHLQLKRDAIQQEIYREAISIEHSFTGNLQVQPYTLNPKPLNP